jgi:hypothetical protein
MENGKVTKNAQNTVRCYCPRTYLSLTLAQDKGLGKRYSNFVKLQSLASELAVLDRKKIRTVKWYMDEFATNDNLDESARIPEILFARLRNDLHATEEMQDMFSEEIESLRDSKEKETSQYVAEIARLSAERNMDQRAPSQEEVVVSPRY